MTFRIIFVDVSFIDLEMKFYLQSTHQCRINRYHEKVSYLENLYHACDTIMYYGRRIEGFSFMKVLGEIYPRENVQEELKTKTPREVREKIVAYFDRNHKWFQDKEKGHH